ncbi:hypothetical protein BJF93_19090 [Xaviernesmea oryzae]|uniref:Uncharacterized protein n=1 Tax=Xaviernesmea oryzae TaxID=464029 RepID=A0A1Q9B1B3_9HYPH|nr:hypothetical protein [Xaviernesmea oryzae]OLP61801.1 hypothetical protein BJF93_19090 [Xaviernesmea oryzae]SEL76921.1 hypothetical protein SAMN04487976_112122 [Xaviernesmea oryzae]
MAMRFTKTKAILSGVCTVEEAERLFEWLTTNPKGELQLGEVTHLHTAALQAIAASANRITKMPDDPISASALGQLVKA